MKLKLAVAALVGMSTLGWGLTPGPVSAAEYCTEIFVVSGAALGNTVAGANPGSVGCQFDGTADTANTNYLVAGATHAWVVDLTVAGGPPTGTLGADSLTFFYNDTRGRWESRPVSVAGLASGDTVTATVTNSKGTYSVTYTKAA